MSDLTTKPLAEFKQWDIVEMKDDDMVVWDTGLYVTEYKWRHYVDYLSSGWNNVEGWDMVRKPEVKIKDEWIELLDLLGDYWNLRPRVRNCLQYLYDKINQK